MGKTKTNEKNENSTKKVSNNKRVISWIEYKKNAEKMNNEKN